MNNFKLIFLSLLSLCGLPGCNEIHHDVTLRSNAPKIFLREKPKDGYYIIIKKKRLKFGKTYDFGGGEYDVMPDTPNPH